MPIARWVFLLLFWLVGALLMWRIPRVSRLRKAARIGDVSARRVSVIIPARNEEHRLTPLLASLAQQSVAPHEVLVVDDNSSDGTAALAERLGATIIVGEALPEGWSGKPWACWQGARRASGDLLLFLDADTWLERDGLRDMLDAFERQRGGMLTVQPYHETRQLYEQLSAFFNIVLMAALNAFTPLGERITPAGAFGPCILCSRDDYARVGGHSVVRGDVLEDITLAQAFTRQNLLVRCYGGRGAISFRMYPGGFSELLEGWSKGFGTGALSIRPAFALLAVAWIYGCFGASSGLWRALDAPGLSGWPHLLLYALYAAQIGWMLVRIGRFRWWVAALYPVPLCFFALVMLRSLILIHVLGRVSWKGRSVATGRRKGVE